MTYEQIIHAHDKYNIHKQDILNRMEYYGIQENVVIAPTWDHSIFDTLLSKENMQVEKMGKDVYNFYHKEFSFSFIELKNMGATVMVDAVLSLGLTKCKQIIMIGSVGAIDDSINIGDLVIPSSAVNGVGATRYLNDDLQDDFEKVYYPNQELIGKITKACEALNLPRKIHICKNYSLDTIFLQFQHIDHILKQNVSVWDLETSSVFRCGEFINIPSAVINSVSDNTIKKKSLFSGRKEKDKIPHKENIDMIIPKILCEVFKSKN